MRRSHGPGNRMTACAQSRPVRPAGHQLRRRRPGRRPPGGTGGGRRGGLGTRPYCSTGAGPDLPERVLGPGPASSWPAAGWPPSPACGAAPGAAGLSGRAGALEYGRRRVVRELRGGPVPARPARRCSTRAPSTRSRGTAWCSTTSRSPPRSARPETWLVPAPADAGGHTWRRCACTVAGGRAKESLRALPALHATGLTSLVISYRGDGAAPDLDGRSHLGDTEWRDVAAAAYALDRRRHRLVLVGWSMGAAVGGAFLDRSGYAGCVAAVVWDAPLLDWRRTLRQRVCPQPNCCRRRWRGWR
ncbi:alpha/beta hydrolase [Pseudonocardia sp. MCCB 268]|nr:alpha/beta hydrolase [Pseudonocardia cytotoxica]